MMTMNDLRKLNKDDVLELLGLETRQSTGAWLAGSLGTFGVGLLVGAGIALMLAPKPGRELREDLRDRLRRARADLPNGESLPREGESKNY
ncbi:MAG TPA: YtxH domain-containing protein [Polyangia bacterium]|nr:YtxH domain-containing protein [Polyangia bacterium]